MAVRKKQKKNKAKTPPRKKPVSPGQANAGKSQADPTSGRKASPDEIQGLLDKGKGKKALELAKKLYGLDQSPENREILLNAYLGRIKGLFDKNLIQEALDLTQLVTERFVAGRDRFAEIRLIGLVRQGSYDELLTALLDPDAPPQRRTAIEGIIRREIVDPALLADCPVLDLDHPVRAGARDVAAALTAVCSGPVDYQDISLDSIPRRSPWAPWKMLVRAIYYYYKGQDEACLKSLNMIDPDSAPARLIPVFNELIQGRLEPETTGKEKILFEAVSGRTRSMEEALFNLDRSFDQDHEKAIYRSIRNATAEFKQAGPDLIERLKRRITVLGFFEDLSINKLNKAMGGPCLKNSSFWKLMAQAAHQNGQIPETCLFWEEFRLHARHEGLFAGNEFAEAATYLHIAKISTQMVHHKRLNYDLELIEEHLLDVLDEFYEKQPDYILDAVGLDRRDQNPIYFIDPREVYARACAVGPAGDTFPKWLEYARDFGPDKSYAQAAETWSLAAPGDLRPLLILAELAEGRKAFNKAFKYLEKAEALDEVNPEVRRARIRVLVSIAKRHIAQKKEHLLAKDLKEIEALPQAQVGDRPVMIVALKWARAVLSSDREANIRLFGELVERLRNEQAAGLLIDSLAAECNLPPIQLSKFKANKVEDNGLLEALARVCILGDDLGTLVIMDGPPREALASILSRPGLKAATAHLRSLAENALWNSDWDLAYLASTTGLNQGGLTEARFLFLKSKSIDPSDFTRRHNMLAVANRLARKQGENELAEEIREELNSVVGVLAVIGDNVTQEMTNASEDDVVAALAMEKGLLDLSTRKTGKLYLAKIFDGIRNIRESEQSNPEAPSRVSLLEQMVKTVLNTPSDDLYREFYSEFFHIL